MTERMPMKKAAQLDALVPSDVVDGYRSGFSGDKEPGNNRSFDYWHGWRNGAMDGGHIEIDGAARTLAHEVYRQRPTPT